jgi:hypothetical protein
MNTTELEEVVNKLITLVDEFPIKLRDKSLFDKWTIREVVIHITGWNLQRIGELEDIIAGKEIEIINDYDLFNRQVIIQKRYQDWNAVHQDLKMSCRDLVSAFKAVPEEIALKKVWPQHSMTPAKMIQIDIEHIQDEHITQLVEIIK